MSNKSISFWLLVACGTLIGTTGAVSISNIDGTVVVRKPYSLHGLRVLKY